MPREKSDPFHMTLQHLDGYSVTIEDVAGQLEVMVRRDDGVSWRGTRRDIEEAVLLAGRIVEEQKLIAQMKEGDRNATH